MALLLLSLVAASASLSMAVPTFVQHEDFLPPISPAEDPPPVPDIERLDIFGDADSTDYQWLEDLNSAPRAFTARRRDLQQSAFIVDGFPHGTKPSLDNAGVSDSEMPDFLLPRLSIATEFHRRWKRRAASPAIDAVDDDPAYWRRFQTPKPKFVTASRSQQDVAGTPQHRTSQADDRDFQDTRFNEIIPPPSFHQRASTSPSPTHPNGGSWGYKRDEYYRRPPLPSSDVRDPSNTYQPQRRVIYYANLPEDSRNARLPVDQQRSYNFDDRYERAYKYPRESRYEDSNLRSTVRGYRYPGQSHRMGPAGSYTIIDAERQLPPEAYFRDSDAQNRYNRIPAPYQQHNQHGSYDQRRGAGPLTNAPLHPSRYNNSPYGRNGGAIPPRNQISVTSPLVGEEPYRDYNPRQPAPWSLQIGTKLTVKDDGRPMPASPGGQRYYVQSQQQYPSRFLRSKDDPDTRLV